MQLLTLTAKKTCKRHNIFYMYDKILIKGFEPLLPFLSLLKWIDLSKYLFK
jgi:hypothetical protein